MQDFHGDFSGNQMVTRAYGTITAPAQKALLSSQSHQMCLSIHTSTACQTVTEVLARVGDKWSMQVVMQLGRQGAALQRTAPRDRRHLPADAHPHLRGPSGRAGQPAAHDPSIPPRVDYELTDLRPFAASAGRRTGRTGRAQSRADAASRARSDLCEFRGLARGCAASRSRSARLFLLRRGLELPAGRIDVAPARGADRAGDAGIENDLGEARGSVRGPNSGKPRPARG